MNYFDQPPREPGPDEVDKTPVLYAWEVVYPDGVVRPGLVVVSDGPHKGKIVKTKVFDKILEFWE